MRRKAEDGGGDCAGLKGRFHASAGQAFFVSRSFSERESVTYNGMVRGHVSTCKPVSVKIFCLSVIIQLCVLFCLSWMKKEKMSNY